MILGVSLIALGLLLAYAAGSDAHDRESRQNRAAAQYAAALLDSRSRHPGGRDAL